MTDRTEEGRHGFFSILGSKATELFSALALGLVEMARSASSRFDRLLRRAEYLLILYLWISIGILFTVLGVFDLLIDSAGIPRGIVYSLGGAFIFLTAVVLLQAAKIRQGSKGR